MGLLSVLIGVLVIVVVGAICFWAIDKFANDRRLANLLKLLVVLHMSWRDFAASASAGLLDREPFGGVMVAQIRSPDLVAPRR